jgi:hypothetical protein
MTSLNYEKNKKCEDLRQVDNLNPMTRLHHKKSNQVSYTFNFRWWILLLQKYGKVIKLTRYT